MQTVTEQPKPLRCAGTEHYMARLSTESVLAMREKHATGNYSYGQLARIFNCSCWTARDIVTRRSRRFE